MTSLPHVLDRSILICATRATVFRYFTDSERFAAWWGPGSRIEGRPGGAVAIRYPNGVTVSGQVLELVGDERIVFTYGYDAPDRPIPPGGSRVTITLEERPQGTLLKLRHELATAAARDAHVAGWRYQLALFANVASRDQHSGLADRVDRYLALWVEPDAAARIRAMAALMTDDVSFKDGFGCVSGQAELNEHIAATQMHMLGMRLTRDGDVLECQGTALVAWNAQGADGQVRGRGSNVLELAPDGRIARVVGIWRP